jgi:hypothetical protein
MSEKGYPAILEEHFRVYNIGAASFLIMSIVQWIFTDVKYAPWLGVVFALYLIASNIRLHMKVKREGFEWKSFKVIDHTYLSRRHRKPTGFIALGFNEGEPIKRYHFALADRTETPEIGAMLEICIPGGARISEIGRTNYVSVYYGIMCGGHAL